jgi:hypothetical protein
LTPEQACSKIYCDPANMHLRRAEREKNGFVRYTDDLVEKQYLSRGLSPWSSRAWRWMA